MARKAVTPEVLEQVRDSLAGDVNMMVAQDSDPKRAFEAETKLATYRRLRVDLLSYVAHMRKEIQ